MTSLTRDRTADGELVLALCFDSAGDAAGRTPAAIKETLAQRCTMARNAEMEARLEVRTVEERLRAIAGRTIARVTTGDRSVAGSPWWVTAAPIGFLLISGLLISLAWVALTRQLEARALEHAHAESLLDGRAHRRGCRRGRGPWR